MGEIVRLHLVPGIFFSPVDSIQATLLLSLFKASQLKTDCSATIKIIPPYYLLALFTLEARS